MNPGDLGTELIRIGTLLRLGQVPEMDNTKYLMLLAALNPHPSPPHITYAEMKQTDFDHYSNPVGEMNISIRIF